MLHDHGNHLHHHCQHCEHYCAHCGVTYCCKCGEELSRSFIQPYIQPFPYWQYQGGVTGTVSCSHNHS